MADEILVDLVVKPGQRFAVVVARFNEFITGRLSAAAVEGLRRHGAGEGQVTVVGVPGAFEIPTAARALAGTGKFAAVICLGCVIRGETSHYDHVVDQVTRGVGAIGPETGVPTIFGVITAETVEQAIDRAGLKQGNAGYSAALAAIEMANLMPRIGDL